MLKYLRYVVNEVCWYVPRWDESVSVMLWMAFFFIVFKTKFHASYWVFFPLAIAALTFTGVVDLFRRAKVQYDLSKAPEPEVEDD